VSGVESIEMTFVTKNVHVKHDAQRTSPAVLLSALSGAGLQASLGKREANEGKRSFNFLFLMPRAKFHVVYFFMEWLRKARFGRKRLDLSTSMETPESRIFIRY